MTLVNGISEVKAAAGALLFAVSSLLPLTLFAGTAVRTYDFKSTPTISEAGSYSRITLQGTLPYLNQGKPVLPHIRANIELPLNATGIAISGISESDTAYRLPSPPEFAPAATPPGRDAALASVGAPDMAIYGSDSYFPAAPAELAGVYSGKSRKVAAVRIFPVRVNPVTGRMVYSSSIRVEISYNEPEDNGEPGISMSFTENRDSTREYLVISSEALLPEFSSLLEEKREAGIGAFAISVETILRSYQGADAQQKIRACISESYKRNGTRYVLLGGDSSVVPVRTIHAEVVQDSIVESADIPCDLYYACLDGTWDSDNDSVYGEVTDGEDGGEIDLIPEVFVGRIPVSSAAEVENFMTKNRKASCLPNPDKALLIGEYLGLYGNTHAYGGRALDEISRLLPAFSIDRLDDRPARPSTPPSWSQETAIAALSASSALTLHSGHGTSVKTMGISADSLASVANDSPFLFASTACHIGSFDYPRTTFVKGLINSPGGAYAAQMNTRQGWFAPGYEHAYSGEFLEAFLYSAIIERMPLGEAHYRSKETLLPALEYGDDASSVYRWCYLESTYFGDPLASPLLPDPMAVTQLSFTNEIGYASDSVQAEFIFRISNTSPSEITISAIPCADYLVQTNLLFSIKPAFETNISIRVAPECAARMTPGLYPGSVKFENIATSFEKNFEICLSVVPPLEIRGLTSYKPEMILDFGAIPAGTMKSLQITMVNTSSVPFTVSGVHAGGRPLTYSPVPADFIAYDRTTGRLCSFSTDSPAITYHEAPFEIDAADTVGESMPGLYVLSTERGALYRIDSPGSRPVKIRDASPAPRSHSWAALAFNVRDGNFYAASVKTDGYADDSTFYIIPTNGAPIARLATVSGNYNSLAADKTGLFYTINVTDRTLRTVNPFTGETSVIGKVEDDINYSQSLDFNTAGTALFWSANTESDASVRLLDITTGKSRTIYSLSPEKGQMFPPELEFAILPDAAPFFVDSTVLPAQIASGRSKALAFSFSPVAAGAFTNSYSLYMAGANAPFATVTCIGRALPTGGVPAWWLEKYGLPIEASSALADPDNDGLSNFDEYLAGTSPVDGKSNLRITDLAISPDGTFSIKWNSVPGFTYTVERGSAPARDAFTPFISITATNTESSCGGTLPQSGAFFRIRR